MKYDFDQVIDRKNTQSSKWDNVGVRVGNPDALPMWVADMDFPCPKPLVDAVIRRAEHAVYGYSFVVPEFYEATIGCMKRQHGWDVKKEWLTFATGIVPVMNTMIQEYTEEGDEIIIPRKTDVVHVSGEVLSPTAATWEKGLSLKGYLSGAGGLSDRADAGNILIVGLNGEVSRARGQAIEPGDRILVMPRFDSKNLQLVKDVTQVLYQMAVAVKVAVGL